MNTHYTHIFKLGVAISLVVSAALLAGCGGGSSAGTNETASAKPGGVLNVDMLSDPLTLAPSQVLEESSGMVVAQISEPLFRVNSAGKIIPQLATRFKVSPDGRTYTVDIRKGVYFSNGKRLGAADVVFTLQQLRHSTYYAGLYEPINHVEASSPTTVVVETKEPMPALKADLATVLSAIVPVNYGGVSEKEFAQHPVGTGPFELKKWIHGESVTLIANPKYWQSDQPLLDGVTFQVVPDDNSRVSQLLGGQAGLITAPPNARLDSLESTSGVHLVATPPSVVDLMLLNVANPLFKSEKIREAVNIAVDREGIVKAALNGRGEPGGSYLAPNLPYFDASIKPPARAVERAKELVAEAVKQEGVDPSFTLLTWSGISAATASMQIVQQDLNEVGFDVKLQPLDITAALAQVEGREFDASVDGYYSGVADPSENVTYFLHSLAEPSGVDTTRYAELAQSAAADLNPHTRGDKYAQLQQLVAEQENAIILDYRPNYWALQDSVAGVEINPLNALWLAKAGFTS